MPLSVREAVAISRSAEREDDEFEKSSTDAEERDDDGDDFEQSSGAEEEATEASSSSSDDDDDEDEEEEEEEEEEELVDPLCVKVQRADSDAVKPLRLANDIKWKDFRTRITAAAGIAPKASFTMVFVDERKAGALGQLSDKADLKEAKNAFWGGTSSHLRVVVTPETMRPTSAMGTLGGTASMGTMSGTIGANVAAAAAAVAAANATLGGVTPTVSMSMDLAPGSIMERRHSLNETNFDTLRSFFDKGEKVKWTEMRVLGTGSYGKVVEAITSTGNIVAVKHTVIPPAEDDEEQQRNAAADVEELVEEIRLMKALRHRNVVQYYGCQTSMQEDGSRIIDIFLEVCHGGSLNTLRKKLDKATGRMPVYLARSYTRQVLEGLAYLHAKQVAHRDIKGDNVLISAEGFAKLADFGCSKKLGTARILETGKFNAPSDGGALCQTLVGTPLFMAPEVLSESGTGYDTSADIWSVGCLVIELFGQKPWKLQGTTLFSIMYAVAQAKTLPTGMPIECDPKMRSFLEACFDRNPATRATAQQLLSHEWITCKEDTLTEPQWA